MVAADVRRTPPTGKLEHRSHEPLFRKLWEIILACGRFMDGRKRCQEGGKTRACICAVGASGVGRASTRACRAKTPVGRTRGLGCPVNRRVGRRPPVGLSKRNPKSDRKINRRNIRKGIRFSAINFSAVRPCLSMNLPMVAADVRRTPPTEKLEHRSHEPLFRKLWEIILACGRFMDRRIIGHPPVAGDTRSTSLTKTLEPPRPEPVQFRNAVFPAREMRCIPKLWMTAGAGAGARSVPERSAAGRMRHR